MKRQDLSDEQEKLIWLNDARQHLDKNLFSISKEEFETLATRPDASVMTFDISEREIKFIYLRRKLEDLEGIYPDEEIEEVFVIDYPTLSLEDIEEMRRLIEEIKIARLVKQSEQEREF